MCLVFQDSGPEFQSLYPGKEQEPVLCMLRHGSRVFITCGSRVLVLNTDNNITVEKTFETRFVVLKV